MDNEWKDEIFSLVKDKNFINLDNELESGINILKILEIKKEIYYSKILAYLLDPEEDHGLGSRFLRLFLGKLVQEYPSRLRSKHGLAPIDFEYNPFENVHVIRERTILSQKRVDIFIRVKDTGWIIVIENKVSSLESEKQTIFYNDELQEKYKEASVIIPIFLAPFKQRPSCKEFFKFEWEWVIEILQSLSNQDMNKKINILLQDFIEIIEVNIVKDEELENLCRQIYEKHGNTLNFLSERMEEYGIKTMSNELIFKGIESEITKLDNNYKVECSPAAIHVFKKEWYDKEQEKLTKKKPNLSSRKL
mgnify:CR=1 FL=1